MVDTAVANAGQTATSAEPKSIAGNIAQAIQGKASGKALTDSVPGEASTPKTADVRDPNAGKEEYTVNGQKVYLTPEERVRWVQKGMAFEPRMSELAKLQQETSAFLNQLKTNPESILFDKRIGHTPKAVLERVLNADNIGDDVKEMLGSWYYHNVIEPMKMTPEQLEARQNKTKLMQMEAYQKATMEKAVEQENQTRAQLAMAQIKAQIGEAMKESGIKDNNSTFGVMLARRVADIMRLGYFQKQAITPKDAMARARAELKSYTNSWLDDLDEENLVKEIGEKNAEKVKKYYLKLVKESNKESTVSKAAPAKRGERQVITPDDMHDYLDNLKKQGK
jgi:hypothetical protein